MTDVSRPRNASDDPSVTDILRALVEHHVEFVICGGVACILQGVNRTTADLDVSVRLSDENLRRFIEAVRHLGMQPRIPEPLESLLDPRKRQEWIDLKNAMVYTVVSPKHPKQVDMFLRYPIDFDDLKKRANAMRGADVTVLVSSKSDLITAKRLAGRDTDLRDIHDLERLLRDEQA